MKTADSPSLPSPAERPAWFRDAYAACRAGTLAQFADVDDRTLKVQVHPGYSPLGWHLGHIVYTEGLWLLREAAGQEPPRPELASIFDVAALPKHERFRLPRFDDLCGYAEAVRGRVLDRLDGTAETEERLWHFVLQHESQHGEIIAFLKRLAEGAATDFDASGTTASADMIAVPAGPITLGSADIDALDNESGRHAVFVDDFRIARHPVTQRDYAGLIDAGGYRRPEWWSAEGWAWRAAAGVTGPLYWKPGADDHPVMGVSAHEAEAYCRSRGLRLPTEAEWEKAAAWDPEAGHARRVPWGDGPADAAHCNCDRSVGGTSAVGAYPSGASAYGALDMLGNVWEWTASPFMAYPGFVSFPYAGFSAAYYDGKHRVLRGGSWATRPWTLRTASRNWYTPETRQILAGFRCAGNGLRD
ncbi:MAG: SUMF1/EgtB/PvdO family nonheme iron enzyme [Candidatus Eiseniibacteriota bacterium]